MTRASSQESSPVRPLVAAGDDWAGGRDSRVSVVRVTEPARPMSLQAPSLICYGVVDGQTVVSAPDQPSRSLTPGELVLVPPLHTVRAEFPTADCMPVRWVALKINRTRVEALLDRLGTVPPPASRQEGRSEERPFCAVPGYDGMERTLRQIGGLFRKDPPHRDALLDLSVQQLIIRLLRTRAYSLLVDGPSRHSATGGIAAAVQYVHDHLDRHISIDELVDEACMSKSSFYRHFGDRFEMSPLEYIRKERARRARTMLSDPSNTVADVSHALGFSSTSHFIDMFKEHVGRTPKQYQLKETDPPSSGEG